MRSYKGAHRLMAASLATALTLFSAPASALAAPDEIGGYDHIFAAQESAGDGSVDILTVTGADGETVYLDIQKDGTTIASHLAFTLSDSTGTVDADGEVVGVVSVVPTTSISLDGATVRVYEDRAQSKLLWEGTVSTVYAKLEGVDEQVPLATRTLGKGEERAFAAPDTLEHGGAVYALASDTPTTEGGRITYSYGVSKDAPTAVDGHVRYYDVKSPDEPIQVDTVAGIERGTSQTVDVPSIISANGRTYRTMQLADKVTLSYPGATEYSVQCLELTSASWKSQGQGSFYKANINYVGTDGASLDVSDSVIVNRRYLYTPPTRLHVRGTDGQFVTYALSASNDLSEGGAVVLEPGQAEGERDVNVVYEPIADDAERVWTVVLVNGSVAPNDPAREIKRVTYRGKPGESVTHKTDATIDVDGTAFVPAASAEDAYDHTFSIAEDQIEQTIYYVPDGWVAPEAYEVKVNYINIATNEVISSESYTAAPTMRRDLEITTPETFGKDGVEYVRLDGQELPIRHSFYAAERAYNVYYRDVNDDLHAKTVIRTVRVEYVDAATGETVRRPTTVIDDGTTTEVTETTTTEAAETTSATTTTTAPTDALAAAVATGIGTDANVVSIVDDENPLGLVTSDGTDLATVRIEDDETPMASGLEGKDAAKDAAAAISPVTVGIIGGIGAAVAAFIVFFFVKRRKREDEESSDDNATA